MLQLLADVDIGKEWLLKQNSPINKSKLFESPANLISLILKNVFVVAGILLLIMAIMGGFSIISSAGSGDAKKAAQGKKTLTTALIGFLIIFSSYWIIQLITFLTGIQILSPTL